MKKIKRRQFIRQNVIAAGGLLALPNLSSQRMTNDIILRTIPSTGEKIPAIGMGSWRTFDVGNDESERSQRRQVLQNFYEKGGRLIDSSPMYGRSEQVIGELAAELGLTDKFFLATKVWTTGEMDGIRQINESTRLFKRAPDLLQVHNLVDFKTHINTIRRLKEEGKIRYTGITHYLNGAHDDVAELVKTEPLDFIQINYNAGNPAAGDYLLPLAAERGVAVIANRPFQSGRLFKLAGKTPLPEWAGEWDIRSWAGFFLKYTISNPHVTCAVPATSNPAHMLENMAACYGPLPDEKGRKMMEEYFGKL